MDGPAGAYISSLCEALDTAEAAAGELLRNFQPGALSLGPANPAGRAPSVGVHERLDRLRPVNERPGAVRGSDRLRVANRELEAVLDQTASARQQCSSEIQALELVQEARRQLEPRAAPAGGSDQTDRAREAAVKQARRDRLELEEQLGKAQMAAIRERNRLTEVVSRMSADDDQRRLRLADFRSGGALGLLEAARDSSRLPAQAESSPEKDGAAKAIMKAAQQLDEAAQAAVASLTAVGCPDAPGGNVAAAQCDDALLEQTRAKLGAEVVAWKSRAEALQAQLTAQVEAGPPLEARAQRLEALLQTERDKVQQLTGQMSQLDRQLADDVANWRAKFEALAQSTDEAERQKAAASRRADELQAELSLHRAQAQADREQAQATTGAVQQHAAAEICQLRAELDRRQGMPPMLGPSGELHMELCKWKERALNAEDIAMEESRQKLLAQEEVGRLHKEVLRWKSLAESGSTLEAPGAASQPEAPLVTYGTTEIGGRLAKLASSCHEWRCRAIDAEGQIRGSVQDRVNQVSSQADPTTLDQAASAEEQAQAASVHGDGSGTMKHNQKLIASLGARAAAAEHESALLRQELAKSLLDAAEQTLKPKSASSQETQEGTKVGLVQSQLEGVVSKETQESIKNMLARHAKSV